VRHLRKTRDAGAPARDHAPSVNRDRRDRVLDWREELRRLEPDLPQLPAAARQAVDATLLCFLLEDAEAGTEPVQAIPRVLDPAA
jgi:hypothetical protein